MLDLDHIRCVLTVAETGSFSRTADLLGLAQSVVSKRVRRVEEQIGLAIFARTSRSVELTRQGRVFLPYAQAMIDAEAAARYAARSLHETIANQLVLGTYDHRVNYRMELMDAFHASYPDVQSEVVFGSRASLLAALRSGGVDVVMIAAPVGHVEPDFEQIGLPPLRAGLMVPASHPLAQAERVGREHLRGLQIVYSPSHLDPLVRTEISTRLMRYGAELVLAPEADRAAMEQFADIRGLPLLRWQPRATGRTMLDGKTVLNFAGLDLQIQITIYALRQGRRPITERFMATALSLRERLD